MYSQVQRINCHRSLSLSSKTLITLNLFCFCVLCIPDFYFIFLNWSRSLVISRKNIQFCFRLINIFSRLHVFYLFITSRMTHKSYFLWITTTHKIIILYLLEFHDLLKWNIKHQRQLDLDDMTCKKLTCATISIQFPIRITNIDLYSNKSNVIDIYTM